MWQIENRTPFAAGQSWVRDLTGAETWLVAVKATFDIHADGTTTVAPEQPPLVRSPVHRGEPGKSSLLYDNDFVLGKVTTDVIVNGTAHAPRGVPARTVDVGLQVGTVRKTLRVSGEREWGPRGTWLSPPVPFTTMPLVYERAFGGIDVKSEQPDVDWYWANPVGCGFVKARARVEGIRAPNIEYPDRLISAWDAQPPPAGLGVISSHWRERAAFAGTYDQAWEDKRQPLPPADFDMRHHQCAPKDQQTSAFLRGGEAVTLIGLTAAGSLRFTLPVMDVTMETRFRGNERRPHPPPRLHTVIVEPDGPRVSLVWHSAIECHPKVYKLEKTRIEATGPNLPKVSNQTVNLLDLT